MAYQAKIRPGKYPTISLDESTQYEEKYLPSRAKYQTDPVSSVSHPKSMPSYLAITGMLKNEGCPTGFLISTNRHESSLVYCVDRDLMVSVGPLVFKILPLTP